MGAGKIIVVNYGILTDAGCFLLTKRPAKQTAERKETPEQMNTHTTSCF